MKRKIGDISDSSSSSMLRKFRRKNTQYVKKYFKPGTELKWKDTVLNAVNLSNTGITGSLVTMAAGTGTSQMLGDEAQLKSVSYKVFITNSAAGLGGNVRLLVVQNKMRAITAVSECLANGGTGAVDIGSLMQMTRRKEIRVLRDETQFLGSKVAGTFQSATSVFFKGSVNLRGPQKAMVTGGTCGMNDIAYILISETSANFPTATATFRVRYYDA